MNKYWTIPIYLWPKKTFVLIYDWRSKDLPFVSSSLVDQENPRDTAMRCFIQNYDIHPNYFSILETPRFDIDVWKYNTSLFLTILKKGHFKYIKENENVKRIGLDDLEKYLSGSIYESIWKKIQDIFVDD